MLPPDCVTPFSVTPLPTDMTPLELTTTSAPVPASKRTVPPELTTVWFAVFPASLSRNVPPAFTVVLSALALSKRL